MLTLKNKFRKILFSRMSQDSIDNFYKLYYQFRYPNEMRKKEVYGDKNPDKTFYVIRPRTDGTEGLMSLFMNVAKNLYYAQEHGYEPIVDFENYHTQYDDDTVAIKNPWEFYFTQPCDYQLDEVYTSQNVILSGLEIQWYRPELFEKSFTNVRLRKLHDFIFNKISFSYEILLAVDEEMKKIDLNYYRTLGLYLRGTDYFALKPSGHPVQPTTEQAIEIVDKFLSMYSLEKVFLVTEDGTIYRTIKNYYKEKCVIVSFDSFVDNYNGKDFLSHTKSVNSLNQSAYKRGMNYLVKLIILSKCSYFIGGDTMGSWAACIFSERNFTEKYIFDLGVYGH